MRIELDRVVGGGEARDERLERRAGGRAQPEREAAWVWAVSIRRSHSKVPYDLLMPREEAPKGKTTTAFASSGGIIVAISRPLGTGPYSRWMGHSLFDIGMSPSLASATEARDDSPRLHDHTSPRT